MLSRRTLLVGSATTLAAPFVARFPAKAQTLRVRADVMEMADNDPFFAKYAAAVRAMHALPESDGRNWQRQAKIHADFCQHDSVEFLHWHRHYITFFEQICGALISDPDFVLPYWNWSKRSGRIPAPFFDLQELNVEHWNDPGLYDGAAWGHVDTIGKRGLDKTRGLLDDLTLGGSFTTQKIDQILHQTTIRLFRGMLQSSPHNDGHVVAGARPTGKTGHIGSGLSPLDPIFWLHHCMVDRVWAQWQAAGNATPDPGQAYADQFFDSVGAPAAADTTHAMTTSGLGYTYDVLVPTVLSSQSLGLNLRDLVQPDALDKAIGEGATRSLAVASNIEPSQVNLETAISVSVPGLAGELQRSRIYRAPMAQVGEPDLNVEGRRVLAVLTDVIPPMGGGDILVNVFVDCPYLSPNTPYTDPHYAGTFSFFGHMQHGGHGAPDIVVDITSAVSGLLGEGRIKDGQVKLQLMPIAAAPGAAVEASFQVGKVEILSA